MVYAFVDRKVDELPDRQRCTVEGEQKDIREQQAKADAHGIADAQEF
jgi:hypothetical protein